MKPKTGLIIHGMATIPNNAETSAGLIANSSLRKKLTARRPSPKIPWTKYTSSMAISSGVG